MRILSSAVVTAVLISSVVLSSMTAPAVAATRHPVVLVHGMGGFDELFGISYFFRVPRVLSRRGHEVYVTEVPAFAGVETRGEALADELDFILQQSGAEKLNIIAHSMGGLDIRYVVGVNGRAMFDRIASITTVAAPHLGTSVADVALGYTSGPAGEAFDFLADFVGYLIGILGGEVTIGEQDFEEGLDNVSQSYVREVFNVVFPLAEPEQLGVYSQSFSGKAAPFGLIRHGWFDYEYTNWLDPFLYSGYKIIRDAESDDGEDGLNDGLVSVVSARAFGVDRGVVDGGADHLDEMGHLLGLTDTFDHIDFYVDVVEELEALGL